LSRLLLQAAGLRRFHWTFMAFILENWVLILAALVSGSLLLWPAIKPGAGGASVSTTEAVRLINREKGVLVDVSEPAEFAAGHAGGARNVPLGQIAAEGVKGLPTNKAIPVVLMCPTGTRSAKAAALLRKAGHEGAVAVAGGTAAWREASLPIEKTA
jgi:rhodanese-related sulfurtransferase